MKLYVFLLFIVLAVSPCSGFAQQSKVQAAYNALNGRWVATHDRNDVISIKGREITSFYKGEEPYTETLTLTSDTVINGNELKTKGKELVFIRSKAGVDDVYYLTGFDGKNFSIMATSNGQTVNYKKVISPEASRVKLKNKYDGGSCLYCKKKSPV